jgi:hypothetical protein
MISVICYSDRKLTNTEINLKMEIEAMVGDEILGEVEWKEKGSQDMTTRNSNK